MTEQGRIRRPSGDRSRAGIGNLLRAAGAGVVILAMLVGAPLALRALGGALSIDTSRLAGLSLMSPDDGSLLLVLVLAVAWVAWSVMAVSIVLEAWALIRRAPTRRLRGLAGPQRLAAVLVSAATLTGAAGLPASAVVHHAPGLALEKAIARSAVAQPAGPAEADGPGREAESARTVEILRAPLALPTLTTARHDTLWKLAERHLGSGQRFTEIMALNLEVPQSDGRALGTDGRLYPGWVLTLPADAVVRALEGPTHVVEPGETLWGIAEDELGDGGMYGRIYEDNEGVRQRDGRRLDDPDSIRPGWVLTIPDDVAGHGDRPAVPHSPDSPRAAGSASPSGEAGDAGDAGDQQDGGPIASETPAAAPPAGEEDPNGLPAIDRPVQHQGFPDAAFALPGGGILAALALAGFAAELVRRRRQYQQYRHPGERMATPGEPERQLESTARAAAAEDPSSLLDRALSQLVQECRRSGTVPPDVRLVTLTPVSVVLVMSPLSRDADPVAPFQRSGVGRWVLDPELLTPGAGEPERVYPALVAVGVTGGDVVLVNLESVGTLALAGPAHCVAPVMRGLAAELGFGRISRLTSRTFCLADATLADALEAGDVAFEPSRERVVTIINQRMAATLSRIRAVELSADPPEDDASAVDPLDVFLVDGDVGTLVPPRSGAGLITSGPAPGAMSVIVGEAGQGQIEPDGLEIVAQSLTPGSQRQLVDLMHATEVLDERGTVPDHARTAITRGPGDWLVDLRDAAPARAVPDVAGDGDVVDHGASPPVEGLLGGGGGAPRILVLGDVRVENPSGRAESSRIGRLSETAAFVLLNPGTRPSDLQAALWPGRRSSPQTCRQMISRTRTWLGRTDLGEPYLLPFSQTDGRLRLREEVASDWDDFQSLARVGLADPDDLDHLTAALSLVRGRPFGSVASRELPWADLHLNDMISLITDVSHELAMRHLRAGRRLRARDAALRGLLTESEAEVLEVLVEEVPV